jgi:ribosomal protein S18 acetylase RimI-like enzyme
MDFFCSSQTPLSKPELMDALNQLGDLLPDPLRQRVIIQEYASKLINHAVIFYAKIDKKVVGLVALYANDEKTKVAHIPLVLIAKDTQRRGVGEFLMHEAINSSKKQGMKSIWLFVHKDNQAAIDFYKTFGFQYAESVNLKIKLVLNL